MHDPQGNASRFPREESGFVTSASRPFPQITQVDGAISDMHNKDPNIFAKEKNHMSILIFLKKNFHKIFEFSCTEKYLGHFSTRK